MKGLFRLEALEVVVVVVVVAVVVVVVVREEGTRLGSGQVPLFVFSFSLSGCF